MTETYGVKKWVTETYSLKKSVTEINSLGFSLKKEWCEVQCEMANGVMYSVTRKIGVQFGYNWRMIQGKFWERIWCEKEVNKEDILEMHFDKDKLFKLKCDRHIWCKI